MLANHNRPVINKLAKNTVRTNKRQFTILFFTIALSAFMLFAVLTVGIAYLDLSRLQNTRLYGSEHDAAVINGFTERQKEILSKNPAVRTVGIQAYCGHVLGTDADDTVNAAFLWGDRTFWEEQKAPARTGMKGRYPEALNELLATREVLEECGVGALSVGDVFSMTYEDNTGIHEDEFIISGIWEGYGGDKENFYVSEEFYRQSGSKLTSDGILQVKFKGDYVAGKTIEKLEESLNLSQRQVFWPSDYIERSLTILFAVYGLCIIICLSAGLLIYNILYMSVSGKIRYYGLLKSLGMTKRQLVRLIRLQVAAVAMAGIAAGVLAGTFISLFMVPYVMEILEVSLKDGGLHFYPEVLALSVFVTGGAILCGIRTPVHIAANVTPVEAARYRGNLKIPGESKRPARRKKIGGGLYWWMAKEQLRKNKKRTAVVFLSLGASMIVFYCLVTITESQGKRTVYPNYWNADFILHNNTQTMEDITSLQQALNGKFISDVEKVKGVREVHAVRGLPAVFPWDDGGFADCWIKGYAELKPYLSYPETVLDYQKNPEKYYGMLKGIDEQEFDYLNGTLGNALEKEDFLNGKTAVLQYAGFEMPEEPKRKAVTFSAGGQTREITIGAVNYGDYYGATVNLGANLIVSEKYLATLCSEPYVLSLNIKYEQSYEESTEREIKELIRKNKDRKDLYYISKYDEMKTIQDSQSGMAEAGTVISGLLLLVGMLNYINTMAVSMQNRKLTFSIMESVGMSERQIRKLLIREGLLYAGGSVLVTLTAGTAITYIVFQSMNYMKVPFAVPVLPVVCSGLAMTAICVMTPVVTYGKTTGGRTVAERLREYE